jgi:serine/threonine protein kinase
LREKIWREEVDAIAEGKRWSRLRMIQQQTVERFATYSGKSSPKCIANIQQSFNFNGWNSCRESMEGGTLADRLDRQISGRKRPVPDEKKLSGTEKMICLYRITRALAWAYSSGVIHQDVKI